MTESTGREPSMIKHDQLNELVAAAGVEATADVIDSYWRSTNDLVESLNKALQDSDLAEAAKVAHALKGSSANVGAEALSIITKKLEDYCQEQNAEDAKNSFETMKSMVEESKAEFDAYLKSA